VSQAIADADTVVFTVWLDTLTALVAENNELLKGKVVVDPTNPLKLDANGRRGSVGPNAARCVCRRTT
jgi:predicted dinucleotide-binding enzyme